MSRKLKFRAWTGTQMMYQDNQYLASFIRRVVLQICMEHGDAQQHESYLPNGGVIDEYLQQYTGLKDKNGKDGYRDDLVKLFDRSLFCIVWNNAYARFQLDLVKGEELIAVYNMDMLHFGEIVGNVYEHGNLLKEGKNG
jgi:YopX protein